VGRRAGRKIGVLLLLLMVAVIAVTLYTSWAGVTIIVDTSAPVFVEGTTVGYVTWRPGGLSFMGKTGLPVIAFIRENVGLKGVKARLCVEEWGGLSFRALQEIELQPVRVEGITASTTLPPIVIPPVVGLDLLRLLGFNLGTTVPSLTKYFVEQYGNTPIPSADELKEWPLYTYGGVFTCPIEANKKYKIVYTAVDTAGNSRELRYDLIPTYVSGYVTVNGKQVGISDTITLNTKNVDIRFYPEDEAAVQTVYCNVNGRRFDMKHQTSLTAKPYWQLQTAFEDGKYVIEVRVVGKSGVDIQFACFNIDVSSSTLDPSAMTYALAGLVGVGLACGVYYASRRKRGRRR